MLSTSTPCLCAASWNELPHHGIERQLQQQADADHDRHRDGGHQGHRAADQPDHGDEQQHERQVDQRHQGRRGEEVAQALELAQVVGERAGAGRPRRHAQAQHLLEDPAGEPDVGHPPGAVDEIAAQVAQQEVEQEDGQHADREHPERLDGVVRHHPVVDVHDEQRRRQREQVDQDRGEQRPRHRSARPAPARPRTSCRAACGGPALPGRAAARAGRTGRGRCSVRQARRARSRCGRRSRAGRRSPDPGRARPGRRHRGPRAAGCRAG